MPTESANNPAPNYMDGGVLYHPTPNTQLDLRVGFGLNGNPGELFTGAGFSVRFETARLDLSQIPSSVMTPQSSTPPIGSPRPPGLQGGHLA